LHRHIFEQATPLIVEKVGGDGLNIFGGGGVLHGKGSHGHEAVAPQLRSGDGVRGDAVRPGRVHRAEDQCKGRSGGSHGECEVGMS